MSAAHLMWPAPATVDIRSPRTPGQTSAQTQPAEAGHGQVGATRRLQYVLVPSAANPKLAVPVTPYAAAAAVASAATAATSTRAAARSAALTLGLRCGVGSQVMRDRLEVRVPDDGAAIDTHLGQVVGRAVLVGFRVGPARANRKPVLQLVTADGTLVGYAKLGVNALTDALVAAETTALTRLGKLDLAGVRIPALLDSSTWQGHQLIVQAALPVGRLGRSPGAAPTAAAMVAVASAEGMSSLPVADLPWWARTTAALADVPDSDSASRLREIAHLLAIRGDDVVSAGAWHGDWNPGNCAAGSGEVLLWDWERYETGVPVGFDALHLSLQTTIGAGVDPLAAAGRLVADAPALLAPFGVDAQARLVTTLYLFALGVRYLHDDQAAAGAAVGRLETWLLPALEQLCAAPVTGSAGQLGTSRLSDTER